MMTSTIESQLSTSDVSTLSAAGMTPADVIDWIKAHGYQGADMLRKLLPFIPIDPGIKTVITTILDLLYPTTVTV